MNRQYEQIKNCQGPNGGYCLLPCIHSVGIRISITVVLCDGIRILSSRKTTKTSVRIHHKRQRLCSSEVYLWKMLGLIKVSFHLYYGFIQKFLVTQQSELGKNRRNKCRVCQLRLSVGRLSLDRQVGVNLAVFLDIHPL